MPPYPDFGWIVTVCVGAGVVAFLVIISFREQRRFLQSSHRQRLFDAKNYHPAVSAGRTALNIGMTVVVAIIVWAAMAEIKREIEEESNHPTPSWAK
jgi:hypothetical protein